MRLTFLVEMSSVLCVVEFFLNRGTARLHGSEARKTGGWDLIVSKRAWGGI